MGLKTAAERVILSRYLREYMPQIMKAIDWLNAEPGRKRCLAAVIFGVSAAVKSLGHQDAADALDKVAVWSQGITHGMDVVGSILLLVGMLHSKARGGKLL